MCPISGKDLSGIQIIIADVKQEHTIADMAKCCKIVVNCVGPYTLFGEPVVRACVNQGTHHLDISAEALFNCQMYKKYNQTAKENGALVVGACGYAIHKIESHNKCHFKKSTGNVFTNYCEINQL